MMGLDTGARQKAKGARRIKYLSPYALSLVPYALYYFYPVKLVFYFTGAIFEQMFTPKKTFMATITHGI